MNLRRCPTCKQHMTRWGSRLYCMHMGCPGSPLQRGEDQHTDETGQLRLPGTEQDAA